MYIPKNRIKTNLYTPGNEFILKSDKSNYIGDYYSLYTGKFFTGKTPNNPPNVEIIKQSVKMDGVWEQTSNDVDFQQYAENYDGEVIPGQFQNMEEVITYNLLNKIDLSVTLIIPQQFYPNPNAEEYALGTFTRYFCVKLNQPIYTELNKETYEALVKRDQNYPWQAYQPFKLQWTITGKSQEVFNTNRNIILLAEKRQNLRGLGRFLKENYLKFYK